MAFLKGPGKAVMGENIRSMKNNGMGEADAVRSSVRAANAGVMAPKPPKVKKPKLIKPKMVKGAAGVIAPPEFDPSEPC